MVIVSAAMAEYENNEKKNKARVKKEKQEMILLRIVVAMGPLLLFILLPFSTPFVWCLLRKLLIDNL